MGVGGGGIPSDYLVSTQLQLLLFCCWGCRCCWAVTTDGLYVIATVTSRVYRAYSSTKDKDYVAKKFQKEVAKYEENCKHSRHSTNIESYQP